jgi:hypothetical protein
MGARGRGRGRGGRGGRGTRGGGYSQRTDRAMPAAQRPAVSLPVYAHALDTAMDYAMHQEAVLTAYNAINSLRQDTPAAVRSLALYAPRGVKRDDFVVGLMDAVRDAGLEGAEIYAKIAYTSGVTFVSLAERDGPATYVLVTVTDFPVFVAPPVAPTTPLEDITWSLPVLCSGKTWYPRFLLPELQRVAFAGAVKLHAILGKTIADREAAGWDMPTEKTEKWFAKVPSTAAAGSPPPAYTNAVDMECLCDDAWDGLAAFAAWLIQQEFLPLDRVQLPFGFDTNSLAYLHAFARQRHHCCPAETPLSAYIYASMASPMHRVGFTVLLILPFFLGTNNAYRLATQM